MLSYSYFIGIIVKKNTKLPPIGGIVYIFHSSPRRLAGEKKVTAIAYNHETTIWVSH